MSLKHRPFLWRRTTGKGSLDSESCGVKGWPLTFKISKLPHLQRENVEGAEALCEKVGGKDKAGSGH